MHPIESMMTTAMEQIKQMVDVNTIVGDPVQTRQGNVILPISKVSFGFVAGGGEYGEGGSIRETNKDATENPFAGGSGAGITIQPIAFLVISNGNVRILQIEPYVSSVDRVVASVPDVVDKIAGLFNKDKKDKEDEDISLPPQY